MAEIVSIKKARERQDRLDHDWGLEILRKRRKKLMRTVPIMSDELTKLDTWLLEQNCLPLKDLIQIWQRCVYCEWVMYGDLTPQLKHLYLLSLRECFQEFQKLPLRWQKKLWPAWERWHLEFVDEEMEEAAHA